MTEFKIPFTSSDVWVLLALAYSSKSSPATLTEIVSAGDMINKSVFTPQELRRGFAKLITAGYAQERDLHFSLTVQGERFLADTGPKLRSVYDRWKLIERKLGAAMTTPQNAPLFEDPEWSYRAITDELVDEAAKAHSEAVEAFIRGDGGGLKR